MEDAIIKLHIAMMTFARERVVAYREAKERGFTTAELLGNAALGIGALVVIWAFIRTTLFEDIKDYIYKELGINR